MDTTETRSRVRWPRWLNTSSKRLWIFGPVVTAVLYLGVLLIYGVSTQAPEVTELNSTDNLTVYLNPRGIKPAEDVVSMTMMLSPPPKLLTEAGALMTDVEVELPQNGRVLKFTKGDRVLSKDFELTVDRSTYEMYPIDSYSSPIVVTASARAGRTVTTLPTEAVVWGKFPGWHVLSTSSEDPLPKVDAEDRTIAAELQDPNASAVELSVRRAGSTMGIVALLLVSMIVLAVVGLAVARSVATKRRRVEATMASWFAAMLFAIVPLRTNMPGSPPIGVWIDFLFFLWVALLLMVALAIFVTSWLRFTPPPQYAPPVVQQDYNKSIAIPDPAPSEDGPATAGPASPG
jgi:hypothetical protein